LKTSTNGLLPHPIGWTAASMTLNSFTESPKLSNELQTKVWKHASADSQIFKVDIHRTPDPNRDKGTPQGGDLNQRGIKRVYDCAYKCNTAMEHFGMLGVCRQSRAKFLKHNPNFIRKFTPKCPTELVTIDPSHPSTFKPIIKTTKTQRSLLNVETCLRE
jgi:hypothetical protein